MTDPQPMCICDRNPDTTDGPDIDCPLHGSDGPPDLRLWQVHEGCENHVVIAFDAAQARGIAFGHRFSDPDEWGDEPPTMPVNAIPHKAAMRIALGNEDGELPTTLAFELERATKPDYLGGSLW
jgi:hypothetical protein